MAQSYETVDHDGASFSRCAVVGPVFSLVCLRQWDVFIGWTMLSVAIVRINLECGRFTCVLRTIEYML